MVHVASFATSSLRCQRDPQVFEVLGTAKSYRVPEALSYLPPPFVPTLATQPTVADCIAATLHGFKTGGYFIDLAANDAVTLSNSYTLEQQYGWKGLCVEPNPEYHTRLLQIRSCEVIAVAVSGREGQAFF